MTTRSRSRLAGAVLAASLAAALSAAGTASADIVPLPAIDTTCLNVPPTDILQCETSSLTGTVTGTVTTVITETTQPATGTTATSAPSFGSTPTATGGTVQHVTTTHRTAGKKRHYSLHRSRHHRRR